MTFKTPIAHGKIPSRVHQTAGARRRQRRRARPARAPPTSGSSSAAARATRRRAAAASRRASGRRGGAARDRVSAASLPARTAPPIEPRNFCCVQSPARTKFATGVAATAGTCPRRAARRHRPRPRARRANLRSAATPRARGGGARVGANLAGEAEGGSAAQPSTIARSSLSLIQSTEAPASPSARREDEREHAAIVVGVLGAASRHVSIHREKRRAREGEAVERGGELAVATKGV